jgi:hypothetical protein
MPESVGIGDGIGGSTSSRTPAIYLACSLLELTADGANSTYASIKGNAQSTTSIVSSCIGSVGQGTRRGRGVKERLVGACWPQRSSGKSAVALSLAYKGLSFVETAIYSLCLGKL